MSKIYILQYITYILQSTVYNRILLSSKTFYCCTLRYFEQK